jgi:release factor glutamine methyltransferase
VSGSAILIAQGAARLAAAGIENPRSEARLLLAHVLGAAPSELVGSAGPASSADAAAAFLAAIARREAHEPIAYITGTREFWSLDFDVGPGVLIPRPETETLIEEAVKAFADHSASLSALDIGTGTACLPIAFLREFPNARAVATDASPDALQWARRNVGKHGVQLRCHLVETQWTDGLAESFDAIFSNPPYIETAIVPMLDTDVAVFEPHRALDGGADGLDAYRALAPRIARHLRQDGRAFIELGAGQAGAVSAIFATANLETIAVVPDLSGIDRCLVAALGD